jgi:hypothetical protein
MPSPATRTHDVRLSEMQVAVIIDALRYSTDPQAPTLSTKLSIALGQAQTTPETDKITWDLSV